MMDNNLSTTVIFGEALVDDFNNEQIVGGAPFNVARHLAAFMAPVLSITRIGDDQSGQLVRALVEQPQERGADRAQAGHHDSDRPGRATRLAVVAAAGTGVGAAPGCGRRRKVGPRDAA